MNQKVTGLIYTVLFVFFGLFLSWDAKAEEINNPELKNAIEAFLKESGDTGDGNKYNWERLGVLNPGVEGNKDTWWASFCDHPKNYLTKGYGGYLSLRIDYDESYKAILCCGDLNLEGISLLGNVTLNANYLNKIIIDDCSGLGSINLDIPVDYSEEDPKPNIDESIKATVSITNCPDLYSFYGHFPSVNSFTWIGTGSENSSVYIKAYNTINNVTLTNFANISSVDLYASEFTGDIEVKNCLDFNGLTIEAKTVNNADVNILFENNQNTSNSFNFTSKNIPLTTLPTIPSSVEYLEIDCIGHNFSEPLDLTYLTNLKSLASNDCGLSMFPRLSEFIEELYLDWGKDYLSEVADLSGLTSLKSLTLNGFTQMPNLPVSIETLICQPGYGKVISGDVDLDGLSSLKELNCGGNKITSILNIPSSLEMLACAYNEIETITISDPLTSELKEFDCSNNKITSFPAELPISLENLNCSQNEISGVLDLSMLSSLASFICDHNNLEEVKKNDNTFVSVTGNKIPISKLEELARGLNNLFSSAYESYCLPQQLTDERNISPGDEVDLSKQLVAYPMLSATWFDVTNDIERLRYDQEAGMINFTDYLTTSNKIEDTDKIQGTEPGFFLFKDLVKGKYLLGEVSETSKKGDYYRYATHYCLVYVQSGAYAPEIEFEITIEGQTRILPNNSETTISWYPLSLDMVEFQINPPVIPDNITYDKWEITYFDSNNSWANQISDKLDKDEAFKMGISFNTNAPMKISVLELKLYEGNVNVETYSYAYAPYRQTFIADNNPILWFEEKINEEEYIEIDNNTTTTKEKGNKVFLRMGALIKGDIINTRSTPVPSSKSWEIEYTTREGGPLIRSGRMNTDEYFNFNGGEPHQNPGKYPYSVKKLFVYNTPVMHRALNASGGIYDFTDNPYNHTIIIKGDGTEPEPEPEPEPEVDLQFAVSINSASAYSDVPNHHTTTVEKGSSVYLRISALTENISYSSWQIDYTNPAGEQVSSGWVSSGSPYVFNGGNPHTEPGTYVYEVDKLMLNDMGVIYVYYFTSTPYVNTIVIKDSSYPGPDPDPNPDPKPGIVIRNGKVESCPDEENVLLPFELIYTTSPIEYTIHFSDAARAVGFVDQLVPKLLPAESYLTIPLPLNVPAGVYKGTIKLVAVGSTQSILDCPFEIKVLEATKITKQPQPVPALCEGDGFRLSVEATGENLSYQWYMDGRAIIDATGADYEAVYYAPGKGNYYVVVTGLCGAEKSDEISIQGNQLFIQMKWNDVMYVNNTDNKYTSFQWYKDGQPISVNGTSIYYTDPDGLNGTYFVRVTTHENVVEESCVKVFSTVTRSSSALIYPNPVGRNENLTVMLEMGTTPGTGKAQLDILDMNGKILLSRRLTEHQNVISLDLMSGTYIARIQAPDGKITTQVLLVK